MASVAFVLFMAEDDTVMKGVLDRGEGEEHDLHWVKR